MTFSLRGPCCREPCRGDVGILSQIAVHSVGRMKGFSHTWLFFWLGQMFSFFCLVNEDKRIKPETTWMSAYCSVCKIVFLTVGNINLTQSSSLPVFSLIIPVLNFTFQLMPINHRGFQQLSLKPPQFWCPAFRLLTRITLCNVTVWFSTV